MSVMNKYIHKAVRFYNYIYIVRTYLDLHKVSDWCWNLHNCNGYDMVLQGHRTHGAKFGNIYLF